MQCSVGSEDGQGCEPTDPQAAASLHQQPQHNCQGAAGQGKATQSVAEKSKVLGQTSHQSPLSADSTRSEEKRTENQDVLENTAQSLQANKNGYDFVNYSEKQIPSCNSETSKFSESSFPCGHINSISSLQSAAAATGRSEVSQNIDQFHNLNERVQQQSIDQCNNQQLQKQSSFTFSGAIGHNIHTRFRSAQPSYNNSNHSNQQNFLYQHHHQQSQGNGPGGPKGFIPQQNFAANSFYPGSGHSHPSSSYNIQNVHPHHRAPHQPSFQSNFPVVRCKNNYEDGPDNLENNSSNVENSGGAVHGQNPPCHQFSLRARRRVRQRVDAGEPRNSYSSIPGFSFRHQSMMSRHFANNNGGGGGGGGDDYTSGLYRGGVFSMRGRGRHLPGGNHPHPLSPYNTHLPFPRYRHPSLVHSHPPFPSPMAAAAVVHRALFQGGLTGSGSAVGRCSVSQPATVSGDDTKTVQSLLRDETSDKLDVLPPISTPPTTPPFVDRENIKVKTDCSESISDPTHHHSTDNNNTNQSPSITSKPNLNNTEDISKNALLIRELLSSKLAAVSDMMEQGFGLVATHNAPRDFSQHSLPINNNDLKENHAAQFMSHLLKVRQEMALNMSKDSDSDRHTESPGHISDNDIIEEEKDEPINLHHNGRSSAVGSGSDGEASPASPSSDAGNSTSSAKDQKASRLENIVGGLARSTSSPLPPQGCKKRKLYLPVQHDVTDEEKVEDEKQEEPEQKKLKDGIENHIKSMQDQFQRMHEKIYKGQNDENADPEDNELHIDLSREDKKFNKEEITIEKRLNPKPFASLGHPLLNGSADPLPIPPSPLNPNYMEVAKRFLQEKQDQLTKEMITRELVDTTIGKNEIAEKLKAISPELEGLADILKSELKTSLTIIVDSIVQRYLTQKRQPLTKFSENSLFNQETKSKTPSGRAPQVRDRSTPRTMQNPVSMANPVSGVNTMVSTNNLVMTATPAPRFSFPPAANMDLSAPKPPMMAMYPSVNGQISDEEKDDESEQDDALNLTVTPKKKRHKVTDTRITPRTVSRLLADQPSLADIHKHFGAGSPFVAPGFLPRPPFPGLPASFLPNIPTSLNPSLSHPADHFPFSPFGFPGPLNRPRDLSPQERPRSASPPRDTRPPPPLIHPALLAAQSPDFPHLRHMEDNRPSSEAGSDDLKMEFGNSPFSLGNMSGGFSMSDAHNATLTPMHLRKAKLMFFWVRYPSSAILKMYFPDIKFNKNNTAQLVKWFSNFREFYYIQMEKYARQALSEGIKNAEDIHVSVESELYRVLNLHYNRNNHIEVPDHFSKTIEATLREFHTSIRLGKDAEPSWKKQIYKIIARFDELIPEYFKTPEFLQQLE